MTCRYVLVKLIIKFINLDCCEQLEMCLLLDSTDNTCL